LSKDVEVEFFIEAREVALCSDSEELVGEVHEDAEIARSVVDESGLELVRHEGGVARGLEDVVEAGEELVVASITEDEASSDAAAEREQVGSAQALWETLVAGKDDAEELLGVEVFAGEDSDLVEDGGEGFLCFVDDEDGAQERGGDVIGPTSAQGLEVGPAIGSGEVDGEEVAELAIKIGGTALGVLDDADEDVWEGFEILGDEAQCDALTGAWVACDHGKAAICDAESETTFEGVDGRCGVERLDGEAGPKGVEFEAVAGLVTWGHCVTS
jgi:hypothetical protein